MTQTSQLVTFGIENDVFAIPVQSVQEILDLRQISRIPQAPAYVLGLMDVRGAGILVMDLRGKLGLPMVPPTPRTRVIVIEAGTGGNRIVGLVTDCVFEVTDLDGAKLQPPPTIGQRWTSEAITGVARHKDAFVIVLDLERLLDEASIAIAA